MHFPSIKTRDGAAALDYESPETRAFGASLFQGNRRAFYVPLCVTVVGAAMLTPAYFDAGGLQYVIGRIALTVGWNALIMYFAIWLFRSWTGIRPGVWWSAMLKLAAVVAGAFGICSMAGVMFDGLFASVAGFFGCLAAYIVLITLLFEIDLREAFIAWLVTSWVRWASYGLLHMYLGAPIPFRLHICCG